MHTLFSTPQRDLFTFFRSLPADDIRDCCTPSIYRRGQDYFESDAVSGITYDREKTMLKAIVSGDDDYTVKIMLHDGKISGSCTCPYYDVCKHLVATILYASDDESEFEVESMDEKNTGNQFQQYLQSLSKNELVALVEKYASEQFRTEVKNKFANTSSAQTTFHNVEQKIRKIFDNDGLMYSPNDFSNALDNELEKLSGLEKSLRKEIEGLLFDIIQKVDEAFEEGYLYEDYGDWCYEASKNFEELVSRYITSLDSSEKTTFLAKLDAALKKQSYNTFERLINVANSVFSDIDLPSLKNVLMQDYQNISPELAGKYYDSVSGLLSYNEKVEVLTVLQGSNGKRAIELAALHDANGNLSKAIHSLKTWLAENRSSYYSGADVWSFYLDLLRKGNHDLSDAAAEAIINCPTDTMLSKIISVINSEPSRYELLLEKKNAEAMLCYLQKQERLPEALALIKRKPTISESQVLDFFRLHKMIFPEDAATFFGKVIDQNLESTGDRYYEAIADAVRHLMKVNQSKANEYLKNIRTNYKRRRNLMALLDNL